MLVPVVVASSEVLSRQAAFKIRIFAYWTTGPVSLNLYWTGPAFIGPSKKKRTEKPHAQQGSRRAFTAWPLLTYSCTFND